MKINIDILLFIKDSLITDDLNYTNVCLNDLIKDCGAYEKFKSLLGTAKKEKRLFKLRFFGVTEVNVPDLADDIRFAVLHAMEELNGEPYPESISITIAVEYIDEHCELLLWLIQAFNDWLPDTTKQFLNHLIPLTVKANAGETV